MFDKKFLDNLNDKKKNWDKSAEKFRDRKTRPKFITISGDEIDEPQILAGTMVQHQIDDKVVTALQCSHVFPAAQLRIHRAEIRDRKSVIGTVGENGQQVHHAERIGQVTVQEGAQRLQWCPVRRMNAVTVCDQNNITVTPVRLLYCAGAQLPMYLEHAQDALAVEKVDGLSMSPSRLSRSHQLVGRTWLMNNDGLKW